MSDLKTSLLVNRQVPEFVREEHPKFISFLEAYYEFLDQTAGGESKDLRYVSDVDQSLEQFEQQFFNTFLPFIPRDTPVNKELIIKNILPLYLSKGSEKSYQLLFRMLFGEEATIETPGKQILRASDGRWVVENYLRVDTEIYSEYVSNGTEKTYYLPFVTDIETIFVYLNGVLTTNYEFRKEYRKIIFNTAPSNGTIIKIVYTNFDVTILDNVRVLGLSSGANAIVERVSKKSIAGTTFYQFFIDNRKTFGTFENGELVKINFIDANQNIIPLILQTFSELATINIINGGSSYNIGDPVIVLGQAIKPAYAIVSDVVEGTIDEINVQDGGCGYRVNNDVLIQNVDANLFFAQVFTVDDSGKESLNTITYNIDVISDYASLNINDPDYGFPSNTVLTENVNTTLINAFTNLTISDLGSITSVNIELSEIVTVSTPIFEAIPETLYANTKISDLGIIGIIDIVNGGANYNIGEYLIFTNESSFAGQGANAYVSNVSVGGSITEIAIVDGGLSYDLNNPPTITVDTAFGSGANLIIGGLMGRGASFSAETLNDVIGRIRSIRILDFGKGYISNPEIDLTKSGDGNALASANISGSVIELPGKWKTSDSLLSTDEIKLQGRDYYINYSYVINSKVEFAKYKSLLKELMHPAGFVDYAKYRILKNIESKSISNVSSSIVKTVSGTVNFSNNSNNIIGVNSNFATAQSLGIIETGNVIAIGNFTAEIVSINAANLMVISNVTTTNSNSELNIVTSTFTYSANNETIKILT
jgi:hypothetical protein